MKDCMIILGYPTNNDGSISPILKSRCEGALAHYKKHPTTIIVSGGAVHNHYSESECMKNYLISQGVKQEDVLIENKAVSTYHNFLYSKPIMEAHNLNSPLVITNKWHMVQARHYAARFNLDASFSSSDSPKEMSILFKMRMYIGVPAKMFYNAFFRGLY